MSVKGLGVGPDEGMVKGGGCVRPEKRRPFSSQAGGDSLDIVITRKENFRLLGEGSNRVKR